MNTKIFPQPATAHAGENVIFIVYKINYSQDSIQKVKDLCGDFTGMIRSICNRFQESNFCGTMAFGAEAWSRLFPNQPTPKELTTFKEIKGDKFTAVSTPGDLFFHIRAKQMGICFEFASIIDEKLKDSVTSIDETHGFRYMDGKSIIGFVDGTENPAVDALAENFGIIGDEDPN